MGKYLDILARAEAYDKNDRNDKSPTLAVPVDDQTALRASFGRFWSYTRRP
jgi:hypothetical protein